MWLFSTIKAANKDIKFNLKKKKKKKILTIMFIIFLGFLKDEQIFSWPKVKTKRDYL